MDEDAINSAAGLQVRLPRGFTMDHCQIVRESRNRAHRHAVRDQYDWHATLSGRQVERDSVRVAVIRSHRQAEARIFERDEIGRASCRERVSLWVGAVTC